MAHTHSPVDLRKEVAPKMGLSPAALTDFPEDRESLGPGDQLTGAFGL